MYNEPTKILKTNFHYWINDLFLKIAFFHKRNALSLKEQSQPLDDIASAVQKRSMYLDRSFRYW